LFELLEDEAITALKNTFSEFEKAMYEISMWYGFDHHLTLVIGLFAGSVPPSTTSSKYSFIG
jgi:hypothetical protein